MGKGEKPKQPEVVIDPEALKSAGRVALESLASGIGGMYGMPASTDEIRNGFEASHQVDQE